MPSGTTMAVSGLLYGIGAIVSLAGGGLIAQIPGAPVPGVEYGALGLCTFMIVMQFRSSSRMGRVIDAQHREFVKIAKDAMAVITENTAAMRACVEKQRRENGPPRVQT